MYTVLVLGTALLTFITWLQMLTRNYSLQYLRDNLSKYLKEHIPYQNAIELN